MKKNGVPFAAQHELKVYYQEQAVGTYYADFVVANNIIVEMKTVSALDAVHRAQCMNYLRAAKLPLCLLINFGRPKVEIVRIAGKS